MRAVRRVAARVTILVGTFVLVGLCTAHALSVHAVSQGAPEVTVRMGAAMGGLFAGGLAAAVVGLLMIFSRENRPAATGRALDDDDR